MTSERATSRPLPPRVLLRDFLMRNFSAPGELEIFCQDYFEDLHPNVSGAENLLRQANAMVTVIRDHGRLDELWPALRQRRPRLGETIDEIERAWAVGPTPPKGSTEPPSSEESTSLRLGSVVESAVNSLADVFITGKNVTFFVGMDASEGGRRCPPQTPELARRLLRPLEIELVDPGLLPPLDLAGRYFTISRGEELLEGEVLRIIMQRSMTIPKVYEELVGVLSLLGNRPVGRLLTQSRPLIFSTSFDLLLERALLRAGISFSRLVQNRSRPQIDINEYRVHREGGAVVLTDPGSSDSGGRIDRVAADDSKELDRMIRNHRHRVVELDPKEKKNRLESFDIDRLEPPPEKGHPRPILYKFLGSHDIENSCTISIDQHFEFYWDTFNHRNIPKAITDTVANTQGVFLGYNALDPSLRLIYQALLRGQRRTDRYSVEQHPTEEEARLDRRVEAAIWHELGRHSEVFLGITRLEESAVDFLTQLGQRLEERMGQEFGAFGEDE